MKLFCIKLFTSVYTKITSRLSCGIIHFSMNRLRSNGAEADLEK